MKLNNYIHYIKFIKQLNTESSQHKDKYNSEELNVWKEKNVAEKKHDKMQRKKGKKQIIVHTIQIKNWDKILKRYIVVSSKIYDNRITRHSRYYIYIHTSINMQYICNIHIHTHIYIKQTYTHTHIYSIYIYIIWVGVCKT